MNRELLKRLGDLVCELEACPSEVSMDSSVLLDIANRLRDIIDEQILFYGDPNAPVPQGVIQAKSGILKE